MSIKQIAPNKFEGVSGYEAGKVGGYVSAKFTASSIEEMKRDIDRLFSDNTRAVDSRTKDMKVTITIEDEKDIVEPAPEELIPFEGENYKGFDIKQDEETGAFDIYSTGGALVAHTETLELAKSFIDNVDVGV